METEHEVSSRKQNVTQTSAPTIVWFRNDLRLADHPALAAAASSGCPLICVYIYDDKSPGLRKLGAAMKWWLHGALAALDEALTEKGGGLLILRGAAQDTIKALVADIDAGAIYWSRRYDEAGRDLDAKLKADLKEAGVAAESFNAHLLHEPWTLKNKSNGPFRVYSAFWRAARATGEPEAPLAVPRKLTFHAIPKQLHAKAVTLEDLKLLPKKPDWAGGLRDAWAPGETAAHKTLSRFLKEGLPDYPEMRNRPDAAFTSGLSPYLAFGHISPRQIWHAAKAAVASGQSKAKEKDLEKFLAEIGWREFSYHLLFYYPTLAFENLQKRFDAMPWLSDTEALHAWQRGQTGYPIVDAGMRELWTTGWMHNRVRMVVASFLAKHLLIDWRKGEEWFWDTLVDADPANNAASWQWVAGSGADAAPYFRIFNPVLQGEKFDPDGAYVRLWVPELAQLSTRLIHKPWTATEAQLEEAGIQLGKTYPKPIVDHDAARKRALASFKEING
jgi:deoxyribodipyrimidine photo-lyase